MEPQDTALLTKFASTHNYTWGHVQPKVSR